MDPRHLARLPDDGNRYEVVRGDLFVTPAPGTAHHDIVEALVRRVASYVYGANIGNVHTPRSVMVFEGSEVEPDMMVLPRVSSRATRWEDRPTPLLVVEVLSSTTAKRDRIVKRSLCLEAGVGEYWIVDAGQPSITVVRLGAADSVVTDTIRWHPSAAAIALEFSVPELFAEALGPA